MNIIEEKEKYKTAKEWAEKQVEDYYFLLKSGTIDEIDERFLGGLVLCETWEQVEEIGDWRENL